jgi:hypothetical protein
MRKPGAIKFPSSHLRTGPQSESSSAGPQLLLTGRNYSASALIPSFSRDKDQHDIRNTEFHTDPSKLWMPRGTGAWSKCLGTRVPTSPGPSSRARGRFVPIQETGLDQEGESAPELASRVREVIATGGNNNRMGFEREPWALRAQKERVGQFFSFWARGVFEKGWQ